MAELPESLKEYLPYPLLLVLTIAWFFAGDPFKEWIQEEFTHPPAQIHVESRKNHLYVVHIEVTRYSDKAFEEVRIELLLQSKPDDITGQLTALDGSHSTLAVLPKNPQSNAFLVDKVSGGTTPITLLQRESIELDLHESTPNAVREVSLYSKGRRPISSSDLSQHWPMADIAWRAGLAFLGFCALSLLYKLLVRLFSRKALRQLEVDVEFLHNCWQRDATALARFAREFQPLIDDGTAKYLKAFDAAVRDACKPVVAHEICRRARTLPKFRRSLQGEVQRFVICFCVEMVEHEYAEIKKKAKEDEAHIH